MKKLIKISCSPFSPGLEVLEDIVIQLHVPNSEKNVTIMINPNIIDYNREGKVKNIDIRQYKVSTPTDETKILPFDLANNRKHQVNVGGQYDIELVNIGKEKIENQDFLFYEFDVSKS